MRMSFVFFQAEDGIRDIGVTGVQTCALPICSLRLPSLSGQHANFFQGAGHFTPDFQLSECTQRLVQEQVRLFGPPTCTASAWPISQASSMTKIGRASCRERV